MVGSMVSAPRYDVWKQIERKKGDGDKLNPEMFLDEGRGRYNHG